jgi:hypothetical protein
LEQVPWSRQHACGCASRLIDEHPEHVIVAHGEIVRTNGETFLRHAFSWLL